MHNEITKLLDRESTNNSVTKLVSQKNSAKVLLTAVKTFFIINSNSGMEGRREAKNLTF